MARAHRRWSPTATTLSSGRQVRLLLRALWCAVMGEPATAMCACASPCPRTRAQTHKSNARKTPNAQRHQTHQTYTCPNAPKTCAQVNKRTHAHTHTCTNAPKTPANTRTHARAQGHESQRARHVVSFAACGQVAACPSTRSSAPTLTSAPSHSASTTLARLSAAPRHTRPRQTPAAAPRAPVLPRSQRKSPYYLAR